MANLTLRIKTKRLPRTLLFSCAGILLAVAAVIGFQLFNNSPVPSSQTETIQAQLESFDVSAFRGGSMVELRTTGRCAHFVCIGVTPFDLDAFMQVAQPGLPLRFQVRREEAQLIDSCGRVEMLSLASGDEEFLTLEDWNAEMQTSGAMVTSIMTVVLCLVACVLIWVGIISPKESDRTVELWERHSVS